MCNFRLAISASAMLTLLEGKIYNFTLVYALFAEYSLFAIEIEQ
jgi:hypothetical protein